MSYYLICNEKCGKGLTTRSARTTLLKHSKAQQSTAKLNNLIFDKHNKRIPKDVLNKSFGISLKYISSRHEKLWFQVTTEIVSDTFPLFQRINVTQNGAHGDGSLAVSPRAQEDSAHVRCWFLPYSLIAVNKQMSR